MDPRRGGFNHLVAPTAVDELFAMDSLLFPSVKTEPFHHHHAIKPSTMMTMMDMDVEMELNAALSLDMPDDHNDSDDDVRSTASHSSSDMHSTTSKMTTPSSISSPTPSTASSSSSSVRHRVSNNKSAMYPPEVLAHMPLPPRAEHVDQRERNRLIVKRCYYKKISTLNELRSELERVENNYQVLLKQKHAESVRPSTADELSKQQSHTAKLHQAYVELTLVSDALRKENEELRRVEAEYAKMEKQMAQLKLAQQKNVDQQRELQEQKRRNPIVELKPLTSAECRDVAMEMAAKIMAFRDSKNIFTTGASIFGWRDRHRVKNDKLEFLLEKQFQSPPADHLADMVWKLLSQADTLAKTYSPHLDVMYHEVQRVDSENVVFYHTLERPDSDYRIKALMLASRVYLGPEGGWLIVFKGLDPKKFLVREGEPPRPRDRRGRNKIEPQKEDIWIDTFVWGLFRTAPDGGSISDFGGIVDGTALISASWWMIHMLQFAQRCEASVVGPQFFLAM